MNKEASHYVRLFGGNKIGNLIFWLPLVYFESDQVPEVYKMNVLYTNVQSSKQLNATSIISTWMESSQMLNDNLKDDQWTMKREWPESCCVLSEGTISALDRLVKYINL
jgi:hypothetical protein